MSLDDRTGRFYGVQLHIPGEGWITRYGWFEEKRRNPGDEDGLDRARRNLDACRSDEPSLEWRMVVRTVEIHERQEGDQ